MYERTCRYNCVCVAFPAVIFRELNQTEIRQGYQRVGLKAGSNLRDNTVSAIIKENISCLFVFNVVF